MVYRNLFALSQRDVQGNVDYLERVWKEMADNKVINNESIRTVVADSWVRCLNYGVNFEKKSAPIKLNQTALIIEQTNNEKLIEISSSVMEYLYEWIEQSGFILTLCDQNGIILDLLGEETVIERARNTNFIVGSDWSEEAVGTNGIGTCLTLGKPVQIFSAEHYCMGFQDWTCSGSPIRDPLTGKILGVFDLTGNFKDVHDHNLSLVVTASRMIEEKLKEWQFNINQKMYQMIIDATSDGIIIVNSEGKIISINHSIKKLLGDQFHTYNLNELSQLPYINEKWEASRGGQQVVEEQFLLGRNRVRITCMRIEYGNIYAGEMIIFRENHQTSNWNLPQLKNKKYEKEKTGFCSMVTSSSIMKRAIDIAKIAANNDAHVLLLGESGTGKELFAKAIHNESINSSEPFIPVNCGAIPKDLIESELFGYTEGSFTGSVKKGKKGKFELADKGTLFLDEIGEMPLDMQVSLLRVLEEKVVYPVGADKGKPVTCRIIAATHKNLLKEVEKGSFRADLYYRLNVLSIDIPSLRERKEDILPLVEQFLKKFHRNLFEIEPEVLTFLQQYSWPGNIRQLKNTVERLIYLSQGGKMNANMLPSELVRLLTPSKRGLMNLDEQEGEQYLLKKALYDSGYNHTEAALKLGISRSTLYRKIKKYKLILN